MKFDAPTDIDQLLKPYKGSWGIAGGWAIDLFLNKQTREHQDIEIAIPRHEQHLLRHYLYEWEWLYVKDGKRYPWNKNIDLELPIHQLDCFNSKGQFVEILMNEVNDKHWLYRRNMEVTYPLADYIIMTDSGIPILRPEIVLLYKAKNSRIKDTEDLQQVRPSLSDHSKNWLIHAISLCHDNKEWINYLEK